MGLQIPELFDLDYKSRPAEEIYKSLNYLIGITNPDRQKRFTNP
jgi:hypothetical protein